MREGAPLALLALASAAVLQHPLAWGGCRARAAAPAAKAPATTASTLSPPATDSSFDALAARGAAVAPGMREVVRKQSSGDKVEIAHASTRDTCVRVVFEATAPVLAKLVDGDGHVLASTDKAATGGVLGPRGPVCVRRGDAVSAIAQGADGTGANVRWVAWESP